MVPSRESQSGLPNKVNVVTDELGRSVAGVELLFEWDEKEVHVL